MGVKENIEANMIAKPVSWISGQPLDNDVTLLKKSLDQIAACYPIDNNEGKHGYMYLHYEDTECTMFCEGIASFEQPTHPGSYAANVPTDKGVLWYVEVEHKMQLAEFHEWELKQVLMASSLEL